MSEIGNSKEIMDKVKESMVAYTHSTEVETLLIDSKGEKIFSSPGDGQGERFCNYFNTSLHDPQICARAHLYGSFQVQKFGEDYIFYCPAGLTLWAFPLNFHQEFMGAIIAGPVLMKNIHSFLTNQILKKYRLKEENKEEISTLLSAIPILSPQRVRYLAKLLFIVGSWLINDEEGTIKRQREIYEQQAQISEEIQSIKLKTKNQKTHRDLHISQYYPFEKEKELVNKVKIGDKIGAKTILNELLGYVLFKSGGKLEVIKARVLELMVVLSRAAVEGGAHLEMILGLNLNYLQMVSDFNSFDEISYWLIQILEKFTESVFHLGDDVENSDLIFKAIYFIRDHYSQNIKLEDAAREVHLSPSYFSRVFKKEVGMTFIKFLNKVRVEESKAYMANRNYSLSEIAQLVGFQDQSYFTRIFKKFEEVPPGKFRKTIWSK